MAKYKVVINKQGIKDLMRSAEINNICSACADRVVSSAGEGFEKRLYVGDNRLSYTIVPTSIEASKKNLKHNILAKALGAAKL